MSNENAKKPGAKAPSPPPGKVEPPAAPATPVPPSLRPKVAPLFRRIDWLTFLITFVVVMTGYYLTMAPELTLEDSGELATGSFYAGIPHPPGYPVWTVYTYFWTLLPFKNIAWRVALGEAFSGAVAAGLLGLLVSRGSSLLVEGIEELKAIGGKWEKAICVISGFVAGMLIGFNGFMWSQSVIVEVYSFSVASFLVVLLCIMRWIYATHQYRYFFLAMFFHGLCFTNHQTLIVAALGIEIAVGAASFRMGRQLFLGNSILYLCGLILKEAHMLTALEANPAVLTIFHCVGIYSIVASGLFLFLTRQKVTEVIYGVFEAIVFVCIAAAVTAPDVHVHIRFIDFKLTSSQVRTLCEWLGAISFLGVVVSGFIVLSTKRAQDLFRDVGYTIFWLLLAAMVVMSRQNGWWWVCFLVMWLALALFVFLAVMTWHLGREWLMVLIAGFCWIGGALFYFYMPLAGMTNPPMEWGYPRTVEGFIHAFTRGQYEKTNPSDVFGDPTHFFGQLGRLWEGITEEFNWVYVFLALVPFAFFFKCHRRERAWLIGLTAIYFFMGVFLMILLNPPPDKQAQQLVRVFFTASHVPIALLVGYGMTLVAAYMGTHFAAFRKWGIWGGAIAAMLALLSLAEASDPFLPSGADTAPVKHLFFVLAVALSCGAIAAGITSMLTDQRKPRLMAHLPQFVGVIVALLAMCCIQIILKVNHAAIATPSGSSALVKVALHAFAKDQYGLPIFAGLILVGMTIAFIVSLIAYRGRGPLALTLGIFAIMPLYSVMTHWADNEQRNHWFGYWFGHDMFTPPFKGKDGKPLYPQMTKDAVLFGGTDPGRFCPTYMIFCDSFIPGRCQPAEDQHFDRRDVYIITQNALADGTYLMYIRAQYNRSAQKDPPFFQEFFRTQKDHENNTTNALARAVVPLDGYFTGLGDRIEKRRRTYTSWFVPEHFTDLPGFTARLRASQDAVSKYIYENLSTETQKLVAGSGSEKRLRQALCKDLNALIDSKKPLYDSERFKEVQISEYLQDFIKQNPQSHTRIRLNRLLLEAAYPKEIAATIGGVYPDREIYTPTPEDSGVCFQEYLTDANRRVQHDMQFPNEPRQIKPGEDVHIVGDRVQVSGQVAVMSINGLLTKVIFDHNPKNEFFVEESFPLDWMYPYLSPFGVIMKINREKLPELTQDMADRDHEFWKQFSTRLTGDIINYDTPVKDVTAWVEKTYLRRDFSGFTGDRRFIRDDQGQKAFSKLRSSIGGVYAWRLQHPEPQEQAVAAQQRLIKEADFAFKQAFAFCPYSPEAVFRYVNLLSSTRRLDDAILVAETSLKLDPYNGQFQQVAKDLKKIRDGQSTGAPPMPTLDIGALEKAARDNPADFQAAFNLASAYVQLQQTPKAIEVLEGVMNHPAANPMALRSLSLAFGDLQYTNGLKELAAKLEEMARKNPNDYLARLGLSENYRRLHQNPSAILALEPILQNPHPDASGLRMVATEYNELRDYAKLEQALQKLSEVSPGAPEVWYQLSTLQAALGKGSNAVVSLRHAAEITTAERKTNPAVPDVLSVARQDPKLQILKTNAEFLQLVAPK